MKSDGTGNRPNDYEKALRRPLILASASPRRRDIMQQAGLPFSVEISDAEQQLQEPTDSCPAEPCAAQPADDPAVRFAMKAARLKALDVAGRCPGRLTLGADTVVAMGHQLLGKPRDADDAAHILRKLSGKLHQVSTALAIAFSNGGPPQLIAEGHVTSQVLFKPLSDRHIRDYVATGEPMDKAGAYAVQGLGGNLVEKVEGSFLNVVGLPVDKLLTMLQTLGWHLPKCGRAEHNDEVR